MRGKWKKVLVEDIASPQKNAIVGGPFGSDLVSKDYVDEGIPVIRGQNMSHGPCVGGEFVYVSEEKSQRLSSNTARPGDLIFTQRGTLGQVAIVPISSHDRYIISQSQMKLTVDETLADPKFIYYVFTSPEQLAYIKNNAIQTGVPHTNLSILRKTPITLPPLPEQKAIAHILGILDDKIELNRQMNATLEAMAQALFKSWFVDFDPVIDNALRAGNPIPDELTPRAAIRRQALTNGSANKNETSKLFPASFQNSKDLGWIPDGWDAKPLDKIAHFLNGLALQKFRPGKDEDPLPILKIAQLREGQATWKELASPSIKPEYIIDNGDVIFSWSGSLMLDIWAGGRAALNQHLFKVTSNKYPKWFYYFWTEKHLLDFQRIAADKAVTMGHIKRSHLSEAFCATPPTGILTAMDKVLTPMIQSVINNKLQNGLLQTTRDSLLPKLISGDIQDDPSGKMIAET